MSVHHDDRARGIVFRCRGSGCVTRLPAEGRFLWADDFWGTRAWDNWSGEIAKALPPATYPIVDLPLDHELFHTLYDVRELPQIPSIGFWIETRGATSERGPSSAVPHARAIFDDHGRIMVLITYNTDFGDAFERESDDREYFLEFAARGYAFGVNALVYAMTHVRLCQIDEIVQKIMCFVFRTPSPKNLMELPIIRENRLILAETTRSI